LSDSFGVGAAHGVCPGDFELVALPEALEVAAEDLLDARDGGLVVAGASSVRTPSPAMM
jgi:hypothetical protein